MRDKTTVELNNRPIQHNCIHCKRIVFSEAHGRYCNLYDDMPYDPEANNKCQKYLIADWKPQ